MVSSIQNVLEVTIMTSVKIDFSKSAGIIKPMHAVNNGPVDGGVRGVGNLSDYKAAGIPFARNHDASFCSTYGGEHTVDVHRIFKNFDADENDPNSYVFAPTDKYLKSHLKAGTEIFYRLGASIEHGYKKGTYPPKDFLKWARICEHIIMHYNEGWADGFEFGIKYWEIWNEPDCMNADGSNPCWQGTEDEFIDFYCVSATYLKNRFPDLCIGGPAFCSRSVTPFKEKFMCEVQKRNAPLDFFSYHLYKNDPMYFAEASVANREALDKYGFKETPAILNEWNYVKGWLDDDFKYSLNTIRNLKGASYVSAVFCVCQANPVDMLMYYDARPCGFCGLFEAYTYEPRKPYYSFYMFNELYKQKNSIECEFGKDNIYTCASKSEDGALVFMTYFDNDEKEATKRVALDLCNLGHENCKLSCIALDAQNDAQVIFEKELTGDGGIVEFDIPLFATYLFKINKI